MFNFILNSNIFFKHDIVFSSLTDLVSCHSPKHQLTFSTISQNLPTSYLTQGPPYKITGNRFHPLLLRKYLEHRQKVVPRNRVLDVTVSSQIRKLLFRTRDNFGKIYESWRLRDVPWRCQSPSPKYRQISLATRFKQVSRWWLHGKSQFLGAKISSGVRDSDRSDIAMC